MNNKGSRNLKAYNFLEKLKILCILELVIYIDKNHQKNTLRVYFDSQCFLITYIVANDENLGVLKVRS